MAEVVNTNLEKLFFAKILEDPRQFSKVEPFFFKNDQIKFVYGIIRDNYLFSKNKVVPSPKQIWAMVNLNDTGEEKIITKQALKHLLEEDTAALEDEWLFNRFKAWKTYNHTRDRVLNAVDIIQKMDEIDHDNVMEVASVIKQHFNAIDIVNDDDDDLGDDFDDPENHKQMVSMRKMPTGWTSMDRILGGGWDHATLNLIMGETNVGKCSVFSDLRIKNKNTGVVETIKIEDFFDKIKNS